MKRKTSKKGLRLNKETIRKLQPSSLKEVVGGDARPPTLPPCGPSLVPPCHPSLPPPCRHTIHPCPPSLTIFVCCTTTL
jgi:hypothetical protein